jgi:hypothetical protein
LHFDDIEASLKALLDAEADAEQDVNDVGGGRLIASVRDTDGTSSGCCRILRDDDGCHLHADQCSAHGELRRAPSGVSSRLSVKVGRNVFR